MQVETRVGGQHPRKVPRKVGIALLGVTLLLLVASTSAQASTTPQSVHRAALANLSTQSLSTKGVATFLPTYTLFCTAFHVKSYVSAWGYVKIGYNEIDVGVCYDNNYRPTISWGPFCPSQYFVPFIRTSATNYCGWYRDSSGGITVYGGWTAQLWLPGIGWCCDRTWWYQYGV
jgi:hypothetical protein